MTSVLVVALIFGSILTFAALICGTILALAKMRQSGLSKGTKNSRTDEAKIIQEIYQGLSKMEQRIEALETILMDSQDKKENRNE
ncbi:phage-shock protein [Desulfopila sp. IMCC35008]|uniref:phage-shock protein n=1 Tax=Desulfopila sp. IMCC35008 TaxID=2653858 RepID=UPI0013D32838|nr:phage-shock protein [Desulfopila sp. IMCC35008]